MANIGEILKYVLLFSVIAITLSFVGIILWEFREDVLETRNELISNETVSAFSATPANDSFTLAWANAYDITPSASGYKGCNISIYNSTGDRYNESCYTVYTNGSVHMGKSDSYECSIDVDGDGAIEYCFTQDDTDYTINATTQGTLSVTTISGWLPTLVLVVIAGIIITLVSFMIYRRFVS